MATNELFLKKPVFLMMRSKTYTGTLFYAPIKAELFFEKGIAGRLLPKPNKSLRLN